MTFFVIVGLLIAAVLLYRLATRPTASDKLSLLPLSSWVDVYDQGSLFEKSNMATALVVNAVTVANSMGVQLSINEVMAEYNRNKQSSMDVVAEWMELIKAEMTKDTPLEELMASPARMVCGLMMVMCLSRITYYQILKGR